MTTPPNQAPSTGGESEKMKPCPFCGSPAEIERLGDPRQSTIYACDFCGCRLETGEEWNHGAAWNRRASDPLIEQLQRERDEAVRCVEANDRAMVNERRRWREHPMMQRLDAVRQSIAGLRPGDTEWLATAQSEFMAMEARALTAEASAQQMREALRKIQTLLLTGGGMNVAVYPGELLALIPETTLASPLAQASSMKEKG